MHENLELGHFFQARLLTRQSSFEKQVLRAVFFLLYRCTCFLQLLEKALSGYDAQKEAKDAKAAKEPSKVGKTKKSRLAPDPHPPPEVCISLMSCNQQSF